MEPNKKKAKQRRIDDFLADIKYSVHPIDYSWYFWHAGFTYKKPKLICLKLLVYNHTNINGPLNETTDPVSQMCSTIKIPQMP